MTKMNNSEIKILNDSVAQLTHFVTAAHQARNANLIGSKFARLAAAPAPTGTPSTTDLVAILNNAVMVPGTTSIATVPTTPDTATYQMLGQVQTLDSYISLLTAFCMYNEHPSLYDITVPSEASAFTRAMAKWRNYVITGGSVKAMAGYLPVSSILAQSFSQSVTSADLHLKFLTEIFGDFSFPASAMAQLDSILSNVFAKLSSLRLSFENQSDTLDHFLTYYYFDTVHGTGGTGQPPAMYVSKARIFYLHIDQSTWKASIGKSSVSHFNFNMNYFDMVSTMNPSLVANDMTAINSTIQTLSGKTAAEVNTLMNMQAVNADPRK
jgi:hypothetical protein